MALNKDSYQSDAVANLYRAAFYLAKESKEVGIDFLIKAQKKLGNKLDSQIASLIKNQEKYLKNNKNLLYWAEKVLDQYHKFK
ncbi:hypothetical protein MUP35_03660 [Patescibacteria group bacterium]|nr:hypothetical protein [Patescibacteria group bacterium]